MNIQLTTTDIFKQATGKKPKVVTITTEYYDEDDERWTEEHEVITGRVYHKGKVFTYTFDPYLHILCIQCAGVHLYTGKIDGIWGSITSARKVKQAFQEAFFDAPKKHQQTESWVIDYGEACAHFEPQTRTGKRHQHANALFRKCEHKLPMTERTFLVLNYSGPVQKGKIDDDLISVKTGPQIIEDCKTKGLNLLLEGNRLGAASYNCSYRSFRVVRAAI